MGEALDAARSELPSWVLWLGPPSIPLLAVLQATIVFAVPLVVELPSVRRARASHWTELARRTWNLRYAPRIATVAGLASLASWGWLLGTPLATVPPTVSIAAGALAVLALELLLASALRRAIRGGTAEPRYRRRELVVLQLVFWWPILLPLVLAATMPPIEGVASGAAVGLACAFVAFLLLGGSLGLAKAIGAVRRAPPELAELVRHAAARSVVKEPRTFVVDLAMASAFAIPHARAVWVSERALALLDPEELESVLEHELAHLREPLGTKLLRLMPVALLAALPMLGTIASDEPPEFAGVVLLALLAAFLLLRMRARQAEDVADAQARSSHGAAYARALEKLHRANLIPAVLRGFHAHPNLYDRMLAAGVQPDFARPASPVLRPWRVAVVASLASILGAWMAAYAVVDRFAANEGDVASIHRALVLDDQAAYELNLLALARYGEGRHEAAIALYRGARALEPGSPWHAAALATVLANEGLLEDAVNELALAEVLARDRAGEAGLEAALDGAREAILLCRRRAP